RAKTICSSVNRDFFISTTSAQGSIHHAGILFLNGAGFWVRVTFSRSVTPASALTYPVFPLEFREVVGYQ
ncbi:hypothetical protein, partial [Serratia marcescens]